MIKRMIFLVLLTYVNNGNAQIFFSEDFNSGTASSWVNSDNDSDNTTTGIDYDLWYVSDAYASLVSNSDGFAAVSHSQAYDGSAWVPFNPNNFLTSPEIDLTTAIATDLKLKFDTGSGQLAGGHEEHYAVYVTSSSLISDIELATPVFEETLPASAASNMESHVIDISSFAGQSIYVTIRHFNCSNQFNLLVDNISIEQIAPNNASIESLALNRYSLTNIDNSLNINVVNEGSSPITSIEIDWNDGSSNTSTISGLNILPFSTGTVSHPIQVNYANVTEETINVSILQVNSVADSDPLGNTASIDFNTISTHVNKNVVFEEGTGIWCPSCPSGSVMMETMHTAHPTSFIGIAVHVNDILTDAEYETSADFLAVPNFHADRKLFNQSVADAQLVFNELVPLEVPASLSSVVSLTGNDLVIDATVTFNTLFSNADFRLGAIITEDDVTGTSSDYAQANVFSGGAFGPMGGYENLPNPVPADQMVYDHVARALIGGYDGQVNSIPSSISDGQVVNYTFNYTIPSGVNGENLKVVLVLINQVTGEIESASIADAPLTVATTQNDGMNFSTFPNPAKDELSVSFTGEGNDYTITIYDTKGKEILSKHCKNIQGSITRSLPVDSLQKGIYLITITGAGSSSTKQLLIQ